jgi:hypothetical protein
LWISSSHGDFSSGNSWRRDRLQFGDRDRIEAEQRYASQSLLTDCNCKCEQSEACNGILEQIWAAGAEESGTGAVVLAVVGGVETITEA